MIYTRKHPTYTTQVPGGESLLQIKQLKRLDTSQTSLKKQKVIEAREQITGLSFTLENHTITEEDEDASQGSQEQHELVSASSAKLSSHSKTPSMGNFQSQPRREQILGQINEEEEDTFDAEAKERDNYTSVNVKPSPSPMALISEEKSIEIRSMGKHSKTHIEIEYS